MKARGFGTLRRTEFDVYCEKHRIVGTDQLVLYRLVIFADHETGVLLDDYATFAERLGISRNTLRAALDRLAKLGAVDRLPTFRPDGRSAVAVLDYVELSGQTRATVARLTKPKRKGSRATAAQQPRNSRATAAQQPRKICAAHQGK